MFINILAYYAKLYFSSFMSYRYTFTPHVSKKWSNNAVGFVIGFTVLQHIRSRAQEPSGKYPLVICYIAIEHCTFIVDLPIKNGNCPLRKL